MNFKHLVFVPYQTRSYVALLFVTPVGDLKYKSNHYKGIRTSLEIY